MHRLCIVSHRLSRGLAVSREISPFLTETKNSTLIQKHESCIPPPFEVHECSVHWMYEKGVTSTSSCDQDQGAQLGLGAKMLASEWWGCETTWFEANCCLFIHVGLDRQRRQTQNYGKYETMWQFEANWCLFIQAGLNRLRRQTQKWRNCETTWFGAN